MLISLLQDQFTLSNQYLLRTKKLTRLYLIAMKPFLLGIDFGGTKNAVALSIQGASKWMDQRHQLSFPKANAQSDLNAVLQMSKDLLSLHPGKLIAVGVSFGGPVDYESGTIKLSHHVPGWENFALQEYLENEFNVPVCIDNDANVGALGEWKFGAGVGCKSLLYITVSTGIGGGWIINNQLYRGINSMAGEIGHIVVDPKGAQCSCGKKGCLEAMAAGPAISRQAITCLETEKDAGFQLRQLCKHDLDLITAEMVSQAANEGDGLAEDILRKAAYFLGVGIGQALSIINPERVVLGGGVTKAGKKYWKEVRRSATENSLPGITVDIVPAKFKDDAPLWGAIALANQGLDH